MDRRTMLVSGALVVVWGLALGPTWSEPKETAPAKATVEVTYYFLPG